MRRSSARILDEYLAASARAGDRQAFAQLTARWQPKLLAHAYRLIGDKDLARDIVQDSWADIVKNLGRLEDSALFPAWAYRIISRRAVDEIRRRRRQRKISDAYLAEPKPAQTDIGAIEAQADQSPLRVAIAALPPEQRATISLFYLEEFSVMEVSIALSVPVGTVKTRLMSARKKLRQTLETPILETKKGDHHDGH